MSKVKNKKTLIALGASLAVLAVVVTFAMNYTVFPFVNSLTIGGGFQTEFVETFESPTDWKPCDTTPKLVKVRNTGQIAAQVRIKADEKWKATNGSKLSPIKDNIKLAEMTFANNDWTLRDGYYYLNSSLEPNQEKEFITAVTFNCDADFGEMVMCDGSGNCTSSADPAQGNYAGASYHLVLTAQFMQDVEGADWDVEFGWKEPKTFAKMKSGFSNYFNSIKQGRRLIAYKRSQVLPDPNTNSNISAMQEIQDSSETTPIYMWYDTSDATIYWYSTADAISWNSGDSIGSAFAGMMFTQTPEDISGFEYMDMRKLSSLSNLFYGPYLPDDMSALSHWKFDNINNLQGVFTAHSGDTYWFKQEHMSALEHWYLPAISGNYYIRYLFQDNPNITSLEKLREWGPWLSQQVDSYYYVFYNMPNLEDLSGLETWVTPHITELYYMFYNCTSGGSKIRDISALASWDISNVTYAYNMFETCTPSSTLTDISPLASWRDKIGNVDMSFMFKNNQGIADISPIASWNVARARSFSGMFALDTALTDARALNAWNISSSTSTTSMFYGTGCTSETYPGWYTP